MIKRLVHNLLYKDLSYQIHGAAIEVRKDFGPGHKEKLYQEALANELKRRNIPFEKEKAIKIYSPKDGKYVGLYRPDFIIDEKVIVEVKAEKFVNQNEIKKIYDYLRNSKYELAYFINFASPKLFVKRIIFTNDRKPFHKPPKDANTNNPPIDTNTKPNNTKSFLVSLSLILVLFSGLWLFSGLSMVEAATLYLSPSQTEVSPGETFIEEIKIDLEPGENINVIEAHLKYPSDLLEVIDLTFGNSLLTVIPQKPVINQEQGIISFGGGIPSGYTGRISGDPGESNLLAKIIFHVIPRESALSPRESAKVFFEENSQVLLNDGLGTPAKLTIKEATIKFREVGPPEIAKNEWQEELEKDKIQPEPFKPEIQKNPEMFDNKYFIVFSTLDKQTGIDHCEISETKNKDEENWQRSESPYLIIDQSLRSFIKVKAIDKVGNTRIETLSPQRLEEKTTLLIIFISLFIALLIFYFWIRKLLIKKY